MPRKGTFFSEEIRHKMSEAQKNLYASGYVHPLYGKPRSSETRQKISNKLKGRHLPPETRIKVIEAIRKRNEIKKALKPQRLIELQRIRESLAISDNHYFTGKPCRNGHISPRRISDGRCTECVRNLPNNYVGTDKQRASKRKYDSSPKGRIHQQHYRKSEKRKVTQKRYLASEKGKAYKIKARKSVGFKLAFKRFMQSPKGKALAIKTANARRARMYGQAFVPYSFEDRVARFILFNNECAYCGNDGSLTEDHFVAISKGGIHGINNIVPACRPCNVRKSTQGAELWYKKQPFYSEERWGRILNLTE